MATRIESLAKGFNPDRTCKMCGKDVFLSYDEAKHILLSPNHGGYELENLAILKCGCGK